MSKNAYLTLRKGILAAQKGQVVVARQHLQKVLGMESAPAHRIKAMLWLSDLSDDYREKLDWIQAVLSIDYLHVEANERLQKLQSQMKQDASTKEASTKAAVANSERRQCPQCRAPLYFMPNGRSLYCERCDYKEAEITTESQIDIVEVVNTYRYSQNQPPLASNEKNIRDFLTRGVAAAKNGDKAEAFYYLERLLYMQPDNKSELMAWSWLSELVDDPAQKRLCLEQALAVDPHNATVRRQLALVDGRIGADDLINPDTIQPTLFDEPLPAQAEAFRCPHCNGRMNYTAEHNSLLCEFCRYAQTVAEDGFVHEAQFGQGPFEQDFIAAMATAKGHLTPINMRSFQCQSCAVPFVLSPEMASLTCPYCDSVYVTETAETDEIMPPHALIPFTITYDQARIALRQWFKRHKIQSVQIAPIVGVYLPVWTFDIGGQLRWQGRVSEHDRWVAYSGHKAIFHDDVLVPAGHRLPKRLANKALQGFDLVDLVAYDARYLADWPAERYELILGRAAIQARKQVLAHWRKRASMLTGRYDVRNLQIRTNDMVVESFKLIFLPMWITHYLKDERGHDVTINGQTGVVQGEFQQNIVAKFVNWLKSG